MTPVLSETTVDGRFSEGRLDGSAGCNRYFVSYETGRDHRLTFASEIGSTQMACPAPISQQEQRYLALLSDVAAWQRSGDALELSSGDGKTLLKYAAARPVALVGSAWTATGINNGRGGVVSNATTHLSTASFSVDTITGNAGCNSFTASYEIDGDQITIGRVAATRKYCAEPEGVMAQEQEYNGALARARKYALKSDGLELRDETGSLQIRYRVRKD